MGDFIGVLVFLGANNRTYGLSDTCKYTFLFWCMTVMSMSMCYSFFLDSSNLLYCTAPQKPTRPLA